MQNNTTEQTSLVGVAPNAAPLNLGENVLASMAVDLDEQLHYAPGQLLLTNRRLLWRPAGAEDWQGFALADAQALRHFDHAGVGTLELLGQGQRLARWRFTLAVNVQALRLARRFEQQMETRRTGVAVEDDGTRCPSCRSPLPDDSDECEVCTRELNTPPSTWVLLRLGRFAKPYQGKLLLGFALMLASTAATLVPPYLTIPLMDDVLIPFQNGRAIDVGYVLLLLLGLLGSALLAWGLGWWRTWLLAIVSERIAADMRTSAFEHLLGLSLDYFGAKRTGDLMARIGSETDRIAVFLSLHALDFATDVIMLGMITVILFSANPLLALVTR